MFKVVKIEDSFVVFLIAKNGQILLKSEGVSTKGAAENNILSIKKNSFYDDRFEKLETKYGYYYFVLKASNGHVIGKSKNYESVASRDNGIESVKRNAESEKIEYELS
jgi:uncharacterized protein YegP (UPF0339 family)